MSEPCPHFAEFLCSKFLRIFNSLPTYDREVGNPQTRTLPVLRGRALNATLIPATVGKGRGWQRMRHASSATIRRNDTMLASHGFVSALRKAPFIVA